MRDLKNWNEVTISGHAKITCSFIERSVNYYDKFETGRNRKSVDSIS